MNSLNIGRLFLLFIVLVSSGQQARAYVRYVNGLNNVCIENGAQIVKSNPTAYVLTTGCTLDSDNYVPTGNYTVQTRVMNPYSYRVDRTIETSVARIDGTKRISEQAITNFVAYKLVAVANPVDMLACQYFHNMDDGTLYSVSSDSRCLTVAPPLPPTPQIPDTSCTINSGNDLSVNLSTIDRAQLPTVPGSGSMRHIQVPVDCTGDDVTVNMQLNYTPISLSAGQVIKSSSNGLGVSVVYNSKILSSTDITPVTFTAGSNSMDLAFQAVRDPTVEIKDVPTGAFTASAVLVMTQQ